MKIDVNKFRSAFFEEAAEHLVTLETTLIELEANPEDHELIQRIFRAAHSLKGASGTFGFSDIARLTHRLEELLEDLRDRKFTLTRSLAGVLLRGADAARYCLIVKLGAEISDLSEAMRNRMLAATNVVLQQLGRYITAGQSDGSIRNRQDAGELAQWLYEAWLGASLLAKLRRDGSAFTGALAQTRALLQLH